jgi:hypothetical protein
MSISRLLFGIDFSPKNANPMHPQKSTLMNVTLRHLDNPTSCMGLFPDAHIMSNHL